MFLRLKLIEKKPIEFSDSSNQVVTQDIDGNYSQEDQKIITKIKAKAKRDLPRLYCTKNDI